MINKHHVIVFSQDYCPFSKLAKRILDNAGVEYSYIEYNKKCEDCANNFKRQAVDVLRKISGQTTSPNVFINNSHIGGYTDTKSLGEKELLKLVAGK
jgi:glutaredoxin